MLPDNRFLISFKFSIPKTEHLSYETVSNRVEGTKHPTLDHLLNDDEVS